MHTMNTEFYKQIETAVRNLQQEVSVNAAVTTEEIRHAVRWVMRDNPDIFWFAHQYHYDKVHSSIHFQYTFSAERVDTIQQSINDVIENDFCIEYVRKLTPQEQITYVYKWLVSYCNYNTNSAYNQTIYSVFVRRNSVCTGYAKAAQYLFQLLDVDSCLVFGRLHNDKADGRHCWNLVKCGDQYYHFDACFGDRILDGVALHSGVEELFTIDGVNYNFLCISTHEMLKTRIIEDVVTLQSSLTSWSKEVVRSLAGIEIKQREDIKGCLLSHIGSSADIYLCSKDKNTVLKIFRSNSKTLCTNEYSYMRQVEGCPHVLQCNMQYTNCSKNMIAIEQAIPIVDLLCSHYYKLSLKGLIKMTIDVAKAWKECYERGVLYRDIHICNIYRTNEGTFKLGDFGSCTNDYNSKEIVGNQWFVAPETFLYGKFTESSAIYSMSMVMYFILNNMRPAFWGNGYDEALYKRLFGWELLLPLRCSDLPVIIKARIQDFFKRTLASSEDYRLNNITEFLEELEMMMYDLKDNNTDMLRDVEKVDFSLDQEEQSITYISDYTMRCNCLFVLDISSSMSGSPIVDEFSVVNKYLKEISQEDALRDHIDVSVMLYNDSVKLLQAPSKINNLQLAHVDPMGERNLVKAIVCSKESISIQKRLYNHNGITYYRPYILIFTKINHNIEKDLDAITTLVQTDVNNNVYKFIYIGIDDSNMFHMYELFNDKFQHIDSFLSNKPLPMSSFFKWHSNSMFVENQIDEFKLNENDWMLAFDIGDSNGTIENVVVSNSNEDVALCVDEIESWATSAGGNVSYPDGVERMATSISLIQESDTNYNIDWLSCIEQNINYHAKIEEKHSYRTKEPFWKKWFSLEYSTIFSSIFAPSEVKRKSHLQVQVYLHLYEEAELVKSLAKEADKNAERRDYIPLSLKLKKGDRVDVEFNLYGETKLMSERKSLIWQGSFTKCSFDYFVPENINVDELSCRANLFVNGALIGEMRFLTQIVDAPRNLNPEIFSHYYKKIFISYAHKDFSKVKFMAQAYKAQGVDYFLDRDYLKAGDIYPQKIQDYINSADLFVLCWSKNAAESDYVAKEKAQALSIAKNTNQQDGTLTIHPISIVPRAELPDDMKDNYNFDTI